MRTQPSNEWAKRLIGTDRDAGLLADRARAGTSFVIAGPRGSGRSYLLRAVAAELERHDALRALVRPATSLSAVPYGALDAIGDEQLTDLSRRPLAAAVSGVVVIDDVDALDVASMHAIARAVASRRVTVILGLRTARARAGERPDGSGEVRRTVLDLWLDGLLRRIDLAELGDDDARGLIDLFPDAHLLDSATRAGLVWRADGSRTLLRQLILEATATARAGKDPLAAIGSIPRHSRLAVALERHVSDIPRPDLECLAGVRRLRHLERAAATRLFDAEIVGALLVSGLLHADTSADRRLTANELVAQEAHRQLGGEHVDAMIETAATRMLAEADEWWSHPLAVAVSERWHRLGTDASGEAAYPPRVRARVALHAARDANDRGDLAHAAAHAARGLKAIDDPALHLEAALACRQGSPWEAADDMQARRRLARPLARRAGASDDVGAVAEADARVETLLADMAHALAQLDAARATEAAARAVSETSASTAAHLKALIAAGTAEAMRGRWRASQHHNRRAEAILDARQRPDGIGTRDRLAAVMFLLGAHQIAGADGAAVHRRLEREIATSAREGEPTDLTLVGAAAAISFAGAGRPTESQRELMSALTREGATVSGPDATMIELGVADEFAMAGRLAEARTILARIDGRGAPIVCRGLLYVETTILAVEGRWSEARAAARATAEFTRGSSSAALRIRDLFRLATLKEARAHEIDELVQLAATTDLPLAVEAVRRASAHTREEEGLPVDELRLHALWSADAPPPAETTTSLPSLPRPTSPTDAPEELTAREIEIALLADEGLTNRQIAARLFLSIRTVESHVYQARMKVGAASRRELGHLVAASAAPGGPTAGADGAPPS